MFDMVSGSEIPSVLTAHGRWEDVRDYWYKDADDFAVVEGTTCTVETVNAFYPPEGAIKISACHPRQAHVMGSEKRMSWVVKRMS